MSGNPSSVGPAQVAKLTVNQPRSRTVSSSLTPRTLRWRKVATGFYRCLPNDYDYMLVDRGCSGGWWWRVWVNPHKSGPVRCGYESYAEMAKAATVEAHKEMTR